MNTRKRYLFFDLDDTTTLSRTPMEDDVYEVYKTLKQSVTIVSGAQVSQIELQIRNLPFFMLGQNGNQAVGPDGARLWEEVFAKEDEAAVYEHIENLKRTAQLTVRDKNDLIEHRGSQISYSMLGHHENVARKKLFDPDKNLRIELIRKVPFASEAVEVRIGGTTCFDYFQKGRNKGYNVKRLIDHMKWDKNKCIYFGDALFPGGNDETVMGVIDTFPVENHRDTFEILRKNFT